MKKGHFPVTLLPQFLKRDKSQAEVGRADLSLPLHRQCSCLLHAPALGREMAVPYAGHHWADSGE